MIKNENSLSSFPTHQNSNQLNYNSINVNMVKGKKTSKNVKFNDRVIVYSVESYKELNKLLTYDEMEGFAEFFRENPFGYNGFRLYNKTNNKNNNFGFVGNPNATKRNINNQCCCNII